MSPTKLLLQAMMKPIVRKTLLLAGVAIAILLLVLLVDQLSKSVLYQQLEQLTFVLGEAYQTWLNQQPTQNPAVLISLSFTGGLLASISPCILSLLPVNLSYIGTREITSRRDAFTKASAFVLGVVTVLSLLGLISSFAAIVLVQFQGYFHLAVGLIIILMGLSLAGLIHWRWVNHPFRQLQRSIPLSGAMRSLLTGPYGVGLTFALVSSPCTSPVMIAVLSAAAATESQVLSTLAMVSYALGYTAIIFFASLFAGFVKQTRMLLQHSVTITRVASWMLLVVGGYYLWNGSQWAIAMLAR